MRFDMVFQCEIDSCDVDDKSQLIQYRKKRCEWLNQLTGDTNHAICEQISAMLWNNAMFQMINESRRLSGLEKGYKSSAQNGAIAQFVDQGFVAMQTLSIRRLMDRAAPRPERQVISLRRLLDDIKDHHHLITRENFISYDGLPYNTECAERSYIESALNRTEKEFQIIGLPTTRSKAWSVSKTNHEHFDKLSGVDSNSRSRKDLIKNDVFDKIEALLVASGWRDIAEFSNKFIAHAADEHSRSTLLDNQYGFSLNRLERCHKAICLATAAIHGSILWEGTLGFFPVLQYDHLEHLDAAWLRSQDIAALSAFWDSHVENVESWIEEDPLNFSLFDE